MYICFESVFRGFLGPTGQEKSTKARKEGFWLTEIGKLLSFFRCEV